MVGAIPVVPSVSTVTDEDVTPAGFTGVHDITKNVDYWFNRELYEIEREANRLAGEWAGSNLPTLTEDGEQVLAPESYLARRCGELWQAWPQRIQVKMQDAINGTAAELVSCIAKVRSALTELKVSREQHAATEEKIMDIRRQTAAQHAPVRFDRFISKKLEWTLLIVIAMSEFVANQPVFRLIWSLQESVAEKLAEVLERSSNAGWFVGIKVALLEIASYVEASALALASVLFLLLMADYLGRGMRPLVALRTIDNPYAAKSIAALRREKKTIVFATVLGTAALLLFFFQARAKADVMISERISAAQQQLKSIDQRISEAPEDAGPTDGDLADRSRLEALLARLESDLYMARSIKSNNLQILFFNVGLVCVAFLVGFLSAQHEISDADGEHPDLQPLKDKAVRLRETMERENAAARDALSQGRQAVARMQGLLGASPLATLGAKRERLESVIPRWRTENSRLRGIHPNSVASFRRPPQLDLPPVPDAVRGVRPEGVDSLEAELLALTNEVFGVESQPNPGEP
jgi:hypothetical protein